MLSRLLFRVGIAGAVFFCLSVYDMFTGEFSGRTLACAAGGLVAMLGAGSYFLFGRSE